MKKNKAFNYMELVLAIMIMGVVFGVLLQIVKPNKINSNSFFIATYKNLQKANEELVYKNEQGGNSGLPTDYCTKLSEIITTKTADCTNGILTLPSGVKLSGVNNSLTSDTKLSVVATVKRGEKTSSHTLSVYQATGDVTPSGNDLNSTDLFKFKVFSDETGKYVESTKEGVSFQSAVCLIGSNAQYEIDNSNCKSGNPDTTNCPYPGMCRAEIVMPQGANFN